MVEKFFAWLDAFILKHHKCENYKKVSSLEWEEDGPFITYTHIEYRCSMCGKILE